MPVPEARSQLLVLRSLLSPRWVTHTTDRIQGSSTARSRLRPVRGAAAGGDRRRDPALPAVRPGPHHQPHLAWGLLTVLLGGGYALVFLGLGQFLGRSSSLMVAAATLPRQRWSGRPRCRCGWARPPPRPRASAGRMQHVRMGSRPRLKRAWSLSCRSSAGSGGVAAVEDAGSRRRLLGCALARPWPQRPEFRRRHGRRGPGPGHRRLAADGLLRHHPGWPAGAVVRRHLSEPDQRGGRPRLAPGQPARRGLPLGLQPRATRTAPARLQDGSVDPTGNLHRVAPQEAADPSFRQWWRMFGLSATTALGPVDVRRLLGDRRWHRLLEEHQQVLRHQLGPVPGPGRSRRPGMGSWPPLTVRPGRSGPPMRSGPS